MNSRIITFPVILFMIALLNYFPLLSQDINWTTKPLTDKEIPVAPEKIPDYLWQQIKRDPFTKEHFGWKIWKMFFHITSK